MTHSSEEQSVVKHTLECDQCGKVETFNVPDTDDFEITDIEWLEFTHPHAETDVPTAAAKVTFHTQRCAVGFFRAIVKEAAGATPEYDETEEDPPLGVVDED